MNRDTLEIVVRDGVIVYLQGELDTLPISAYIKTVELPTANDSLRGFSFADKAIALALVFFFIVLLYKMLK